MMYKGIVLEIKNNYSIIMTSTSSVIRIKNKDGLKVGEQIFFHNDDIYEKPKSKVTLLKAFSPLLAIAALFTFLFITPAFKNTMSPYALISFDLNPSMEIQLDENQIILSATGINEDGSNLNLEALIGLSLKDGSNELKEILYSNGYILENDNLLLGFAFLKEENTIYEEEVKNIFSNSFNQSQILYLKSNKETLDKAHSIGVSLGRYEAKINMDEDLMEDSIEAMTIEKITKLLQGKAGVILNEDIIDELQDELEDRLEDNLSNNNLDDDLDDKSPDDDNDENDSDDDTDNDDNDNDDDD